MIIIDVASSISSLEDQPAFTYLSAANAACSGYSVAVYTYNVAGLYFASLCLFVRWSRDWWAPLFPGGLRCISLENLSFCNPDFFAWFATLTVLRFWELTPILGCFIAQYCTSFRIRNCIKLQNTVLHKIFLLTTLLIHFTITDFSTFNWHIIIIIITTTTNAMQTVKSNQNIMPSPLPMYRSVNWSEEG